MKFNKKGFAFLSSTILVLMLMLSSLTSFVAGIGSWTNKAPMTTAKSSHQVAVVDGKIYAIGGYNSSGYLNSVEEYDPATNKWITKASMPIARTEHQVAVVDGKIYAIGGYTTTGSPLNSVEEYDPVTNTWTNKAPMTTARYYHQVAVVGGKIYAIGGYNNNTGSIINSVEEYDPATNRWTSKATMPSASFFHQVVVVGGKIYVIGGLNYNSSQYNTVNEYDPATNKWITKAPMITGRYYHQVAVVGGKIYALGGLGNNANDYLNSVEEYDPETNTWTSKAPMTSSRGYYQTAVVGDKIYAIGGSNGSYLNSVEEYDSISNTWTSKAPMTTARGYHQAAVVGDKIYAIGGYSGTSYLNSVEEYDTGNIDETPPVITIGSYLTTPTNQDITVTATTNEGTLNEAFHIFTENGSFDFVATDSAGNVTKKTVTINNIDKTANTTGIKDIEGPFILKTDGTLWATGENINGQLGDGTQTSFNTWKQVLTNVDKVSSGCFNTFALKKDGTLWMAGADYYGSYIEDSAWRQVLSGVSQMSCGWNHSLALKTDGTLWAAGTNWQGELGDGTNKNSDTWKQVLTGVSQVYGGDWFSVALKKDGTVWATGDNEYGQLGDGTTTDSNSWKQVLTNVTQINTSRTHVFAIKNDDTLWATGMNSSGQLGDGTITNKTSWTQVMTGVYKVSAGNGFSLAIKTDGTLWATGDNKYGQLGDGTSKNSSTWKQVLTGVSKIRAGNGRSSLALKTDGTVWAAGSNEWGEFGNGTNTDSISWIKVFPVNNISDATKAVEKAEATKIQGDVDSARTLVNALSDSTDKTNLIIRLNSIQIINTTGIVDVKTGVGCTFMLNKDGTLWATGQNEYGQFGDGTKKNSTTWQKVLTGVSKISTGYYHTLALKSDGTLWVTGGNTNGQLGDGTYTDVTSWKQVLAGVSQIGCGSSDSLALKSDGTLWMAGGSNTWIQVLTDVVKISADTFKDDLFAIKADGTLWAFGQNYRGQLGDGTTTDITSWKQVLTGVSQVEIGTEYSLALKTDGTVWATGSNDYGQFGEGTSTSSNVWKKVLSGASKIRVYHCTSFVIKTDGTLWGAGEGRGYELGDGNGDCVYTWEQLLSEVSQVSCLGTSSLVIKADGTLWAAGKNYWGNLGDGTTTNITQWKQVLSGVSKAFTGAHVGAVYSLALKNDGTVWGTGYNCHGELGNGTNTNSISWIKVFPSNTISLTTSNATATTVDVTVTDSNPGTTQYQVVSGGQYVSASGTLTTTPTWITLTGKKITVTGLVPNTAYSFQAKARDSANIETAWSQPVTVTTLPEALGTIKINFQPAGSEVPQGYIPDYGEVYGVRNGYSYGWNVGYAGATRDRNINADQKLDTLIMLYKTGKWEMAVDNGLYDVTVCVGDAGFSSTPMVNVEGVNYWTGINLGVNQYLQVTKTVMVTDGRLTIDNGGTADQITKLNYVEIAKHSIQLQKPVNLQASAAQDTVTLTWDKSYEIALYEVEADGSIYAVTGAAFTHTFLEGGTTHSYRVRTVNGAEKSEWSDMLKISTMPEALGTIKINFQPASSEIPQGYIPDYGEIYGVRNGYSYGWNIGYSGAARDRNINTDQKLDTLIMLYKTGKWEMEVEDGSYDVTVCVGDAGFSSTPTVNVEGVNYWAGINLGANQYLQATKTVMVTDGRLTIDNGETADQITKIDYVKIVKNNVTSQAPTTVAEESVAIP